MEPAYLIVNADDYGYFPSVSRGILETTRQGLVRATGIFANSPYLDECLAWLSSYPELDLGVHLNLTHRAPLCDTMKRRLARWGGHFPGKFTMTRAIFSRAIAVEDVRAEWRSQIERCLEHGLELRFLNSHEHLHMLPSLYSLTRELAQEYEIPWVRHALPDFGFPHKPGALVRDVILGALAALSRPGREYPAPRLLGIGESGSLSLSYLKNRIPSLAPGRVYELMCHPGYDDPHEIQDPRLRSYHDWESELRVLTSPETSELLEEHGIRTIGYRNLDPSSGTLVVR